MAAATICLSPSERGFRTVASGLAGMRRVIRKVTVTTPSSSGGITMTLRVMYFSTAVRPPPVLCSRPGFGPACHYVSGNGFALAHSRASAEATQPMALDSSLRKLAFA